MDSVLIAILIIITLIFWLIGLTGNWRRVLLSVVLSYAAIILAFQHYDMFADTFNDIFSPRPSVNQGMALGFIVVLAVAFGGLSMLFVALWRPTIAYKAAPSGGIRLIQSAITALIGWSLGILVVACTIQFVNNTDAFSQLNGTPILNAIRVTLRIISAFVNPWIVESAPPFLIELGI